MAVLEPEHRAGLQRHPFELGIELKHRIKLEDSKLGVERVVVDDTGKRVAQYAAAREIDQLLGCIQGFGPAAFRDQDRGHPAQGEYIVRPARQNFAIGLDRRLAAVVHDQGQSANVPVFQVKRAGSLEIRLGLIGLAKPAQAPSHQQSRMPAERPACQGGLARYGWSSRDRCAGTPYRPR